MRPLVWFAASGRHLLQVEEENLLMTAKHFDQEPGEEDVLTLYSYLQTFSVDEAKQRGSSSLSEVSWGWLDVLYCDSSLWLVLSLLAATQLLFGGFDLACS